MRLKRGRVIRAVSPQQLTSAGSLYGAADRLPTALLARVAVWEQHYGVGGLRMASVFLSYDRDDTDKAKPIAAALEQAGHSVWWDLHIRGGAQFAKVIEEALKAADAVVVLWSANSVESSWVRDEAAAGRDSGRLVPATIDGTGPPLGFRQFQTIDLTDWKRGAKGRGYKELEGAIDELGPSNLPAPPVTQGKPARRLSATMAAVLAAPILVAMALAYLLWPSSSAAVPTVAVLAASNSSISQALSRDLFAKLGILQASNSSALQLVEQDAGKTPDLIFKVDGAGDSRTAKATLLLLSGKTRALLWSGDFQQPSNNPSDLKQQLAYSAANVLDCAADAYGSPGRSLDEQTRRLYLNGCGSFTQVADADSDTLIRTFREVIRRGPQFEPAWGRLLNAEDEMIFLPPFDRKTPAAIAQFTADITAARKLNPDLAEAYIAQADLISSAGWSLNAMHQLDVAVESNPDNASALAAHSFGLMQVGRMKDAISEARHALQLRPFSPRAQESYISALTYDGQIEQARKELGKAEALFPGATNFAEALYRLNLRYGSAEDALKWLELGKNRDLSGQQDFLKARIDPTPANVTAAVDKARKQLDGAPVASANYVQTLATFGRTSELFDFLLTLPRTYDPGFSGVLFRPPFGDFWRDPRSIQVAARFGLVRYWQTSGRWPDFCSTPDLPYDCKAEAAKLTA
jgi:tetratricopeptide (TPR) repeat protein